VLRNNHQIFGILFLFLIVIFILIASLQNEGMRWVACWTANREVRGSNLGQGRKLVREFCSTSAL